MPMSCWIIIIPTVQFEMYREGVQDCEALIFLRDALADKKLRSKLGADLIKRVKSITEDLPAAMETGANISPHGGTDYRSLLKRLYATASEVATALEK